jgi:hypothetical protein
MPRKTLSKHSRELVLKEYSHLCAVCAGKEPQLHHIDENNENDEIENLLPLCPNCHLRDQHNPTRKVAVSKLQLFRKYKDPLILSTEFHPIYLRLDFLNYVEEDESDIEKIRECIQNLVAFVSEFKMGKYYSDQVHDLMLPVGFPDFVDLSIQNDPAIVQQEKLANANSRKKLLSNKARIFELIVEMICYQGWPSRKANS